MNDDTAPFLRRVVIPNGERSASFDLHVTRGLYLRGRVVGPEGSGVAAWVELGRGMHVRAGDDGAFELGPLEPGEFALEVRHAKGFVLPEPVRARAGEDDVEIRLELPGRISGRAIDGRSGAPVRAAVRAYRQDVEGDPRWFHRTESADDGSFRLGFVGGRTYCLQAHTADGRFGWRRDVEVGPGEDVDGCELVLRPGATLRVRHEGDPALTLVRAWIEGLPVASAELDVGEEALLVVPAAPLEVTFEELSGTRWLVRVEADANEELALAFPRRWTKP